MNINQKIQAASKLHEALSDLNQAPWQTALHAAEANNRWFSQENIHHAITGIRQFLNPNALNQWVEQYQDYQIPVEKARKIGVVMAGNIPLVGFQDFWQVLMSGHTLLAKLSSQDSILLKSIAQALCEIEPAFKNQIHFVDLLKEADAYIATGSNNSSRYFEYYFSQKPHIIRKNRASCAVLNGKEDLADFEALGEDIYRYFGLGLQKYLQTLCTQRI